MKHANLLSLLQTGFHTIGVIFPAEGAQPAKPTLKFASDAPAARSRVYTYKTSDTSIEVGDLVIVDTPSGGLKVVEVVEVHDSAEIDPDADFNYKWVVQKVDTTAYQELLEREAKASKVLLELERERKRQEVLGQFKAKLEPGSVAEKLFNEAAVLLGGPSTVVHEKPAQQTAQPRAEARPADTEQ